MIGWLHGTLISQDVGGEVILDVQGVGYKVSVTAPTLHSVGPVGSDAALHIHTHVREDAIVLYGFATPHECKTFEVLIGAHGVGPTLALAVLSILSPDSLARAVMHDDIDALCVVPGVGRKTAARLVLDLKSRLSVPDSAGGALNISSVTGSQRSEVRAALAELGYGIEEIRGALDSLEDDGTVEDLLRQALRELATAR